MLLPRWFKKIFKIFGIHMHRLYYFEKDLKKPIESIESPIPIEVKKASKEDISELMGLLNEKEKERIKKSMKQNSICYIARSPILGSEEPSGSRREGKIAGYSWISTDAILVDNIKIGNLAKGGAFSFNGFVFPEFRNKKVFKKTIASYCEDLRGQGYEFLSNLAQMYNIPAVKARENLNAKRKLVYVITLPFGLHITINGPIGQGELIKQSQ